METNAWSIVILFLSDFFYSCAWLSLSVSLSLSLSLSPLSPSLSLSLCLSLPAHSQVVQRWLLACLLAPPPKTPGGATYAPVHVHERVQAFLFNRDVRIDSLADAAVGILRVAHAGAGDVYPENQLLLASHNVPVRGLLPARHTVEHPHAPHSSTRVFLYLLLEFLQREATLGSGEGAKHVSIFLSKLPVNAAIGAMAIGSPLGCSGGSTRPRGGQLAPAGVRTYNELGIDE